MNNLKKWFEKISNCQYCLKKDSKYEFYCPASNNNPDIRFYLTDQTLNCFYNNILYIYNFDGSAKKGYVGSKVLFTIKCSCSHFSSWYLTFGKKLITQQGYKSYIIYPKTSQQFMLICDFTKNIGTLSINDEEFSFKIKDICDLNHEDLLNKFNLIKTFR